MELSIIILIVATLVIFRKTARKLAGYVEDNVTDASIKAKKDLIVNATTLKNELIAELGDNWETPDQVYDWLASHKPKKP